MISKIPEVRMRRMKAIGTTQGRPWKTDKGYLVTNMSRYLNTS